MANILKTLLPPHPRVTASKLFMYTWQVVLIHMCLITLLPGNDNFQANVELFEKLIITILSKINMFLKKDSFKSG